MQDDGRSQGSVRDEPDLEFGFAVGPVMRMGSLRQLPQATHCS
jgi:hypothetical protein